MKNKMNWLLDLVKLLFPTLILYLTFSNEHYTMIEKGVIVFFYVYWIFNFFVWRFYSLKTYVVSPFNIFKVKKHIEVSYDIPLELLVEKYEEVFKAELDDSFEIIYSDKNKGAYLLNLDTSFFLVWKQIMYVQLVEKGDKTLVVFDCVILNQIVSYGKNQDRINLVLEKLDETLTI